MRMPPATLRRNNRKMMTTTIEFHVGWDDIVTVIGSMLNDQRLGVLDGEITRSTVWAKLRYELADRGYLIWALGDDINEETNEQAIELTMELFPELYQDASGK